MRPESCRPIDCRSCQPLAASCAERHLPPPTAVSPDGAVGQDVRLPEAPPILPPRNAAPSFQPNVEHRPASRRPEDNSCLEPPRAHHASDDRSGFLGASNLILQPESHICRVGNAQCFHVRNESTISQYAQLLMSLCLDMPLRRCWPLVMVPPCGRN